MSLEATFGYPSMAVRFVGDGAPISNLLSRLVRNGLPLSCSLIKLNLRHESGKSFYVEFRFQGRGEIAATQKLLQNAVTRQELGFSVREEVREGISRLRHHFFVSIQVEGFLISSPRHITGD